MTIRFPATNPTWAATPSVATIDAPAPGPRQNGTVKWYNPTKGYGFVWPDCGKRDVFVHISALERAGLSTLNEGQRISFVVVTNRGKESAEDLRVLDNGRCPPR